MIGMAKCSAAAICKSAIEICASVKGQEKFAASTGRYLHLI